MALTIDDFKKQAGEFPGSYTLGKYLVFVCEKKGNGQVDLSLIFITERDFSKYEITRQSKEIPIVILKEGNEQ